VDLRVPVRTHKRRSRCEGWLPLEAFRVNRRADPWGIRSGGIRVAGVVMSRRRRRGGKRTPIGLTRTTGGGGRSTATSICSGNGRVQSAVGCLRSGRVRLFVHLGAVSNARASSEDTATGPPDPPRVGTGNNAGRIVERRSRSRLPRITPRGHPSPLSAADVGLDARPGFTHFT
jgi:hypothetical protein